MKFILLILPICFFNCLLVKGQVLQINGKVVNTDTKSILLIKLNQDTRFDSILKIPVKDGKFFYKTKLKNKEVVNLAFAESVDKGAYRHMPLFLENEKIDLTIYPEEDFDKNIVNGGKLNAQYAKFKQSIESKFNNRLRPLQDSLNVLFEKDEYYSDKMKALYVELSKAESQDVKIVIYKKIDDFRKVESYLSPKAKILEDKFDYDFDSEIFTDEVLTIIDETIQATTLQLQQTDVIKSVCEHKYMTDANWKWQTCQRCGDKITIDQTVC